MMFGIFKKTLEKTVNVLSALAPKKVEKIERDLLEEMLISCDINYDLVEKIIVGLPESVTRGRVFNELSNIFRGETAYDKLKVEEVDAKPLVELIVGVNGAGKTTTIAKLARMYKNRGKKVILGAGDTFRAAAIEQLKLWSERLDVGIVSSQHGHDPAAVAYDTVSSAKAKGYDNVIIDTAGRLHNKKNLQNELQKINAVCDKALSGAPHRKILVLDGTQGSSSIEQAKVFNEVLKIDALIITKLDGTSKGGSIFSIVDELRIPIAYIGTGEGAEDLIPFNEDEFIETLLDGIFGER